MDSKLLVFEQGLPSSPLFFSKSDGYHNCLFSMLTLYRNGWIHVFMLLLLWTLIFIYLLFTCVSAFVDILQSEPSMFSRNCHSPGQNSNRGILDVFWAYIWLWFIKWNAHVLQLLLAVKTKCDLLSKESSSNILLK